MKQAHIISSFFLLFLFLFVFGFVFYFYSHAFLHLFINFFFSLSMEDREELIQKVSIFFGFNLKRDFSFEKAKLLTEGTIFIAAGL